MAVLNKIRQRSVFLIIIIALALFSFVLADVIRNGGLTSGKSENIIATINDEEITREEFARQVEAYQQNAGANVSASQAMNAVWDMRMRRVLLQNEFEELGIQAEQAQVEAMLREQLGSNPNFTNEAGMFDEGKLREYVSTLQATSPAAYQQWLDFEKSVEESAREEIYLNMVRAGVGATLLEGEQAYRFQSDNVDLNFVQIPYSSVPDAEVEVSKEEIRAYMEEHPERFQTEASRDIQYVHFTEEPSLEDEQQAKEEITALIDDEVTYNEVTDANDTIAGFRNTEDAEGFVNANSDQNYQGLFRFRNQLSSEYAEELFSLEEGELFGPYKEDDAWKVSKVEEVAQIPDSAQARHILISYQGSPVGQGITRTKLEAKALADSIVSVVENDPEQFAELATEYSADASNKNNAGELGWFGPGAMVPAFNDFVFENEVGDYGVVETRFGYHVINIQEQTEEERAMKFATITREIVPSEGTMNDLFAEVTNFEISAAKGDFTTLAENEGKQIRPVADINALDENIPGVGPERRIVQWAFEEDAEVGDIRRFDVPTGYVVAQLTEKNEEGLMSVESASATVLPILEKQKKAEIIKSRIEGNTLDEIAQNQNTEINTANAVNPANPVLPGAGNEPKVIGAAFALEPNAVSEPLAGERGVYVIKLLSLNKAPELDSYRPYTARLTSERRTTVNTGVIDALEDAAEIEDNRARFY